MSVSAAGKALAWGLFALHAVARAAVYELPADGSAVFGTDQHIKATYKDTLLDIARRYSLGYEEIIRANPGVDLWLPGAALEATRPRAGS
jgi:L,D-transpeptidase ErfK/SrfK